MADAAGGAYGTRYSADELAQMADEFDRGDYEVVEGSTRVIEPDVSDTGTSVLSVRLPRVAISTLKESAEAEGVGATVLARRWLLERLSSEAPLSQGTVDVVDLLEWLHAKVKVTQSSPSVEGMTGVAGASPTGARKGAAKSSKKVNARSAGTAKKATTSKTAATKTVAKKATTRVRRGQSYTSTAGPSARSSDGSGRSAVTGQHLPK